MKKKCGKYFDILITKVIKVIEYLKALKIYVEDLNANQLLLNQRIDNLESRLEEQPEYSGTIRELAYKVFSNFYDTYGLCDDEIEKLLAKLTMEEKE